MYVFIKYFCEKFRYHIFVTSKKLNFIESNLVDQLVGLQNINSDVRFNVCVFVRLYFITHQWSGYFSNMCVCVCVCGCKCVMLNYGYPSISEIRTNVLHSFVWIKSKRLIRLNDIGIDGFFLRWKFEILCSSSKMDLHV